MMQPKIWISNLTFNDTTTISLESNDIVVFVGPNNAGKSISLKEIKTLLKSKEEQTKVIKDITIESEGSNEDLDKFLQQIVTKKEHGRHYGYKFSIMESSIIPTWQNCKSGIKNLVDVFSNQLTTEERLISSNPAKNINRLKEAKNHPIHFLQEDDSIEQKFSKYFKQAFGLDLVLHRNAGSEIPIFVGERPKMIINEDRLSYSYQSKIEKLDLLHEQGDGMRSFLGVTLNAFVSYYSILFIDEPEAFLHPPQARLLGKMLINENPNRQVFLATHSIDFIQGLLEAKGMNLKIIRINRNGNINSISVLNNSDISDIWGDSLLRFSNVLDGLFHSQVILCESDSDCRFYSAIMNSYFDKHKDKTIPDVLFIHCGGKKRLPMVIKALKKINVPLKVIGDIDVLNNIDPLKSIFENLDGDWSNIETNWRTIKSGVDDKRPETILRKKATQNAIDKIFDLETEASLSKDTIKKIEDLLKKPKAWDEAKKAGISYIPAGQAMQAYSELKIKLNNKGLFIVEVGELEGFVKSVGGHGPSWLTDVLAKDIHTDPEFDIAKRFVADVIGY